MTAFRVGVFPRGEGETGPRFNAYVRDFNPAWSGCCLHHVDAESGSEAKRVAVGEHLARCVSPPCGCASRGTT